MRTLLRKKSSNNHPSIFTKTKKKEEPFFKPPMKAVDPEAQKQTVDKEQKTTSEENSYQKGDYVGYFSPDDSDKLIIKKGDEIKSNGVISIKNIRSKLVGDKKAKFTLNAVVRIAKYVGNNIDNIDYSIPTDLSGTENDNIKIVPNEIILGIALLQANSGISIDGMPGSSFIKNVMEEFTDEKSDSKRQKKFMDESSNNESKNLDLETINIPDFNSDESTLYDFFRDITLVRNGLWSDNENITNITGVRRRLDEKSTQWNDTIAVSWVTKENNQITKHAKVFTGTTEPGNLESSKILLPQTIIFKLGYHNSRQPAFRGHRMLTKQPNGALFFNTQDGRGLNSHPGGSTGAIDGMQPGKLPAGTVANEEQFKANLIITEIFSILSRWGINTKKSAYKNLKHWKDAKELISENTNTKINIYKEGQKDNKKELKIKTSKEWLANYWINIKKDRASLVKILQGVDVNFNKPDNFDKMTKSDILKLITNTHIENIVKKQIEYFGDVKQIDGKAGKSFIDILDGNKDKIKDLQVKAAEDFTQIEELFKKFDTNSTLTNAHKSYLKNNIITRTLKERNAFKEKAKTLQHQAIQINENVGGWSTLCQVIFGPEKFYEFMMHVSDKSIESGQRKWYYTLVDLASITKKDKTTDKGEVKLDK